MPLELRAEQRTRAALQAVDDLLVQSGSCPRSEGELISARLLPGPAVDPWGRRLFYTCLKTSDDLIVEARSAGPDGVFWTADDIVAE